MKKLLMSLLLIFSVCSFGFSEKVTQEMIEKFLEKGTYIKIIDYVYKYTDFKYNDYINLSYKSSVESDRAQYIRKELIEDINLSDRVLNIDYGVNSRIYCNIGLDNYEKAFLDNNYNLVLIAKKQFQTEQDAIDAYIRNLGP